MADYLYAQNDPPCEAGGGNEKWNDSVPGIHSITGPDASIQQHEWTAAHQGRLTTSNAISNGTFYDPTSDFTEFLADTDQDDGRLHPRKSQLSHSRSLPGLHQPQPQDAITNFRAGSVSLEIPQPAEFTAYSFESQLNSSSSLFSPSNLSPHTLISQNNFNQLQQRVRTSSNASVTSSAGFDANLRSRSDSEGSSSWAGINTPITPADMGSHGQSYKPDYDSFGDQGFGQSPQLRLNTSNLGASHVASSAPLDHSAYSSATYPLSNRHAMSALSEHANNLQSQSAQHAYASSIFPAPPLLQSMRQSSAVRRLQSDSGSPVRPNQSPVCWDSGNSTQVHRPGSPNGLNAQHLVQPMSASSSYSRSTPLEGNIIGCSRSSTNPADVSEEMHRWNNSPLSSAGPVSALVGPQFASMHLGGPVVSNQVPIELIPESSMSRAEREALLAPFIRLYLSSTNRFLLGERTVLVLSGKVAQKSYGAEKRFLCPPPSALLLGCSWWAAAEADPRRPMPIPNRLALHPPTTIISMSGEHTVVTEAYAEWMSMSGHVVGDQASLDDVVIAGRCVGKQLHISEVDEKTKKVEALVRVIAPGFGPPEARHIGTFPSKPIKVISKPSKKRQSIKNLDLCIHHGTTIALFNRLRSQTVSTKYLCVSGPSASFPAGDWRAMSGMEEKPFAPAEDATCFVARTSAWDPFIIYLVDPSRPSSINDNTPSTSPQAGYPRAPSNALPLSTNGCPIPIYYNQPIVLQCLSTAVVSPVMVIRKVDKGSTATGGASLEGSGSCQRDMPVAPGEVLGDPVSQLHKVALEVMNDPRAYSTPTTSLAGFPGCGSFLACLGENVGVHRAESGRQPVPPLTTPPSSASSLKSFGNSSQDALAEAAYMSAQFSQPGSVSGTGRSRSTTPQGAIDLDLSTSDGGKVRRNRKVSASLSSGRTLSKNRKRQGSVGSASGFDDMGSENSEGHHHPTGLYPYASKVWTIECGEPAVWTIVGCDVERHTFWIPPVLINGKPSSPVQPGTVSDVFTTPIPSHPIGYETATPIPVISKYLPPNPVSADPQDLKMITIYGANLSPQLHVWFGDQPSPHVEHKCAEVILVQPPISLLDNPGSTPVQIILVRQDGIVFPSKVYFSD